MHSHDTDQTESYRHIVTLTPHGDLLDRWDWNAKWWDDEGSERLGRFQFLVQGLMVLTFTRVLS
jgi:hypothetical protein